MTSETKRNPLSRVVHELFIRPVERLQRYHVSLEGYAFILIMVLIGFAAWHSGANLLYLMFAMLIGFFLVQGIAVWMCLLGIDVTRVVPRTVTALEEVDVKFEISNRKRYFNSYGLRILDYFDRDESLGAAFVVNLPRHSKTQAQYRAVFPRRGMVTMRKMVVSTRYPFGFAQRAMTLKRKDHVLVYPPAVDVSLVSADMRVEFGEHESRRKGVGTDLYGLKEYVPGDHVRHIHWRSSAKAQRLMTMEYENEERQKVSLILHNRVSGAEQQDARVRAEFEKALTFVASFCRDLVPAGYEVQLITDSGIVPFGVGPRHLMRLLRACALLELNASNARARVSPEASSVYLEVFYADGSGPPMAGVPALDVRLWDITDRKFVRRSVAA